MYTVSQEIEIESPKETYVMQIEVECGLGFEDFWVEDFRILCINETASLGILALVKTIYSEDIEKELDKDDLYEQAIQQAKDEAECRF